jgi:hypothetical protein
MACRVCRSENLQKLAGELTFSLPDLKDSKVAPVYLCQEFWVCLDCGFADLRIPADELDLVRKK